MSTSSDYTFTKGSRTDTLIAHFIYDPGSPAEPVPGHLLTYYQLTVLAGEGGYVYGGGRYQAGKAVSLSAYCNDQFDFIGWTDRDGDTISTDRYLTYTTQMYNDTLRANFRYNPASPSEPSDPILHHRISVVCSDGGTAYTGDRILLTGKSTNLNAYPNTGYKFVGWFLDGKLYTALKSFSYTMADKNVVFEARFVFDPDSPSEPDKPADKQYALYLMSEVTYPGTTINCPLYLTSLDDLKDMTFQLTFEKGMVPDWTTLKIGDLAKGYTASVSETGEEGVYVVSLIGGQVKAGNKQLLSLKVHVPDTIPVNTTYAVKLNQVSVTEPTGNTVTASTRNGRIYVYELGDTNGDGVVDVTDKMNIILDILKQDADGYIPQVADVNEDGIIDVSDAVGVITIILNNK